MFFGVAQIVLASLISLLRGPLRGAASAVGATRPGSSGPPGLAWRGCSARRTGALALTAFILVACTTRAGIAEFVAYSDAFAASQAASDGLFDLLAIAERSERRLAASPGGGFDPNQAAAFATIGDPPLAAAYRRAFATITRYNTVMVGLTSGQSARQLSADITGLASDGLALAGALAPGLAVPLASFLPLAQTLGEVALTFQTRAAFQQELATSAGDVRSLMQTLRNGSPVIFGMLAAAGQTSLGGDPGRTNAQRELVANWVVLMDRNIEALDVAVAAGRSGSAGDITALRTTVAELRTSAEAVRAGLAALASR